MFTLPLMLLPPTHQSPGGSAAALLPRVTRPCASPVRARRLTPGPAQVGYFKCRSAEGDQLQSQIAQVPPARAAPAVAVARMGTVATAAAAATA
jgi:hypothetical protein